MPHSPHKQLQTPLPHYPIFHPQAKYRKKQHKHHKRSTPPNIASQPSQKQSHLEYICACTSGTRLRQHLTSPLVSPQIAAPPNQTIARQWLQGLTTCTPLSLETLRFNRTGFLPDKCLVEDNSSRSLARRSEKGSDEGRKQIVSGLQENLSCLSISVFGRGRVEVWEGAEGAQKGPRREDLRSPFGGD